MSSPPWSVRPGALGAALAVHQEVFLDGLSEAEVRKEATSRDAEPIVLLVYAPSGEVVGYGIFFSGPGGDAHLWQGGVLPGHRHRGAATALLDQAELSLSQDGATRLTVKTYNHWASMLSLLVRRGYRIYETRVDDGRQDLGIRLAKELRIKRELRLSLTERCNFKCVFCHNEGLEKSGSDDFEQARASALLAEAVRHGYTDITFTGGEPLLRKADLAVLLRDLGAAAVRPDVTVVTNGMLLDDDAIAMLRAYPGKMSLHVSLHTADPEQFQRVTGVPASLFEVVNSNVARATAAGLKVKINAVILHDVNHRPEQLERLIALAQRLGAGHLKLLELLVVEQNVKHAGLFHESNAVAYWIERLAGPPVREGRRRRTFQIEGPSPIAVEVQQLTCQLGCAHCRELRDRTVDSRLTYHPCFVRTKEAFPLLEPAQLAEQFARGDRLIDGFSARFGESSPTLQKRDEMVTRKGECFLWVKAAPQDVLGWFGDRGYRVTRHQQFVEEYFEPQGGGDHWRSGHRVLKLGRERSNETVVDLVSAVLELEEIGVGDRRWTAVRTRFLFDDGPLQFKESRARDLLRMIDFACTGELAWEITTLSREAEGGAFSLNIGVVGEAVTLKVGAEGDRLRLALEEFASLPWTWGPVSEPLHRWAFREGSCQDD